MKYIFLHIGKTAGTSYRTFLEGNIKSCYHGYNKLHFLVNDKNVKRFHEVEKIGEDILERYQLFSEHCAYGLHKKFGPNTEYTYLTILRHPIERAISLFKFQRQLKKQKSPNISAWCKTRKSNGATMGQLNVVSGLPSNTPVEEKKRVALKNLENDNFIFGFTELYNEFIDINCAMNDWKPQYKKENRTTFQYKASVRDKEVLIPMLSDEIDFYDKAMEIYKRKYIFYR